jgi:hypothetical protein
MIGAAIAVAFLIALSVTWRIVDTDFWQHLAVGRAIWQTRSIPQVNVWTWPTYGEPQVLPSWGFRALLWPFYALGGVLGLFVWRWLTTLAAFGIGWAAARRMGARGFTPFVVLTLCALAYRLRAQVRPETLAAVLLALEIWVLEARRHPAEPSRRDPTPWLVVIAWAWANIHISYYVGLVLIGIHVVAERLGRRSAAPGAGRAWPLEWTLLASVAASFLNPFGWHALAQPFEYFFLWRKEPLFISIGELRPMGLPNNIFDAMPFVPFAWLLLALWRSRRVAADWAELATSVLFVGLGLSSQRFIGPLAIAAAPYAGRDLEEWVRSRPWPEWTGPPWNRAALAIGVCAALIPLGWGHQSLRPGMGVAPQFAPMAACDFIAAHGLRGRAYNEFELGGYLLWRFWPDRGRLPFMDIHQTGTPRDRLDYVGVMTQAGGWRALDERYGFEWALVKRVHAPWDITLDRIEADDRWALVFADDAGVLFARRGGARPAFADSFSYALAPAGVERRARVAAACLDDSTLRARTEAELVRMADASAYNSQTLSLLASMLILDRRWAEARATLERAHRVDPNLPLYDERMHTIADSAGVLQQP